MLVFFLWSLNSWTSNFILTTYIRVGIFIIWNSLANCILETLRSWHIFHVFLVRVFNVEKLLIMQCCWAIFLYSDNSFIMGNLNWLLHKMYLMGDFTFCNQLIEMQMQTHYNQEYLFYMKVSMEMDK